MTLVRYRPFGGPLWDRDLLDRPLRDLFGRPDEGQGGDFRPPADLIEEGDRYLIAAELPGLRADDVKITVEQGILTVEGEKKAEPEPRNRDVHHGERTYGYFRRQFRLPDGVGADQLKATSRDGVLTIAVPKPERARVREIAVETA